MMDRIPYRTILAYSILAVVLGATLLRAVTARPARSTSTKQVAGAKTKPAKQPLTKMEAPAGKEYATFAAGCFWSMEAIFKQLKGVEKVEPGYAGGTVVDPGYENVESGTTGHAETINILFNPKEISYRDLLRVLLTVRDPTTVDRQGPDQGPQYRSVIFTHSKAQQQAAKETIQKISDEHLWQAPIVTEVTPFTNFYRAEDYHLDYYRLHPDQPYCRAVIAPEIADFQEKFKDKLKPQ